MAQESTTVVYKEEAGNPGPEHTQVHTQVHTSSMSSFPVRVTHWPRAYLYTFGNGYLAFTDTVFRGKPSSIPAWGVGVKGPLSADGRWATGRTPNGSPDLPEVRGGRSGAQHVLSLQQKLPWECALSARLRCFLSLALKGHERFRVSKIR